MTAQRKRPLQRKRVTVQHKPVPPNIADPPFVAGLETREEASNWVRSHFRNALDEQLKEIEDKRKLVQQLESELRPAILAALHSLLIGNTATRLTATRIKLRH